MKSEIRGLRVSHVVVPLANPVSDAKVATGRQAPLSAVDLLFVEAAAADGAVGVGFSYTLRAGGTAFFALAEEIGPAVVGADGDSVQDIWQTLAWRTNSLGAGGVAYQVIAAFDSALWDLKAKRAGLPLARLWGAYRTGTRVYNSGGQYLQASIPEMQAAARESVARGIGGIKMKVGQPDWRTDIERIEAVRDAIGPDIALMIDANQQWSRAQAWDFCRRVDGMGLTFIEEPLDARDYDGHGALAARLSTPVATGEMLTSHDELSRLIEAGGAGVIQADAPRIGGFTPFLRVMERARTARLTLAPHFVMEQHVHLTAAYPTEGWVEHFDWLEPLFDERLAIRDGRIWISERGGLGLTLSDRARELTRQTAAIGETVP